MGKFRNAIQIFWGENKIDEVEDKTVPSEDVVEKALPLTEPTLGVVGNSYVTYGANNNKAKNPYQSNYVVYRGITLLAQNIAKLPIKIFRGNQLLDMDARLPNLDIHNPNSEMSFYELIYQACTYYFYRGEFMIYINRDDTRMTLEPVNPTLMVRSQDGLSWKWDNHIRIPDEQLIYAKLINPDGERGLSPIDVVKAEILSDNSALEYNNAFFENFGKVGGMIYDGNSPAQISPENIQVMVNDFNAVHRSGAKAHGVLGIPGGAKYEQFAQTMKEMQFLESRADIRDRILGILGLSKALLGIVEDVNLANGKEIRRSLWLDTLQPNAIRIQHKINQSLFKVFLPGYYMEFDFNSVSELKDDITDRLDQAAKYKTLGYNTNEINEKLELGMEDLTDTAGTLRLVPSTLIPVDDYLMDTEPDPVKSIDNSNNINKIALLLEKDNIDINKSARTYMNSLNRLKRKSQKAFNGKLRRYFSTQLGKVIGIVKGNKSDTVDGTLLMSQIYTLIQTDKIKLSVALKPVYEDASIGSSELAQVAVNAKIIKPRIHQETVDAMANNIGGINNYTYKLLKANIREGLDVGETVDQIADRVKNVYKFNASRSATIARTETLKIVSKSTDEEYREAGVEKKQWVGGHRASHVDNNSKGIVDYDYVYNGGLRFPGDTGPANEVINCTCCLVAVVERD